MNIEECCTCRTLRSQNEMHLVCSLENCDSVRCNGQASAWERPWTEWEEGRGCSDQDWGSLSLSVVRGPSIKSIRICSLIEFHYSYIFKEHWLLSKFWSFIKTELEIYFFKINLPSDLQWLYTTSLLKGRGSTIGMRLRFLEWAPSHSHFQISVGF